MEAVGGRLKVEVETGEETDQIAGPAGLGMIAVPTRQLKRISQRQPVLRLSAGSTSGRGTRFAVRNVDAVMLKRPVHETGVPRDLPRMSRREIQIVLDVTEVLGRGVQCVGRAVRVSNSGGMVAGVRESPIMLVHMSGGDLIEHPL